VKRKSYEDVHYSLIQPPATSSLLGPNILLTTLFSNTLNLCPSLGVSKIVILYIYTLSSYAIFNITSVFMVFYIRI